MATSFPYAFQPQPPSHPKTNAGKRGPSLPIAILSPSDDSESDISITDFSPPSNSRPTATESNKISVPPLPSPRNHSNTNKKPNLPISLSPRLSTNNTSNVTNSPTTSIATNQVSSSNLNSNTLPAATSTVHTTSTTYSSNVAVQPLPAANSHNASGSFNAALSSSLPVSSSTSSSLPSTISLPTPAASGTKTLPPAIIIPPQTGATLTTGIPALCNSALSPTASSQSPNTNSNSSSHDSHKENNSPSSSPSNRSCSPSSNSNFAYEHDHDYDNVASPCSSTASGPTYIRPAGFQHHAQEFIVKTKPKKKKTSATLVTLRDGYKKREPTPPKLKPKREPLPMKLRAFPHSFWQQPNVTNQVSPASNFPILPPLCHKDTEEAMDERPVTPSEEREAGLSLPERKITVANTDLLLKLFDGIGEEKKSGQSRNKSNSRHKKPVVKTNTSILFNGNDPFLMEDVTEKIFPQLNLEGRKPNLGGGNACLQLITLKDGDRDVTLPSLSNEQNYPQLLSELVMHI